LLTDQLYNWQYFTRGPNGFSPRPTWVVHDGPPFTNGKSHVGHMYNKVLKDVINRYKLLRGYQIHYVPGFDCFGTHNEDFFSFEN
jgi:isoleucyl-tRNA synthetase